MFYSLRANLENFGRGTIYGVPHGHKSLLPVHGGRASHYACAAEDSRVASSDLVSANGHGWTRSMVLVHCLPRSTCWNRVRCFVARPPTVAPSPVSKALILSHEPNDVSLCKTCRFSISSKVIRSAHAAQMIHLHSLGQVRSSQPELRDLTLFLPLMDASWVYFS